RRAHSIDQRKMRIRDADIVERKTNAAAPYALDRCKEPFVDSHLGLFGELQYHSIEWDFAAMGLLAKKFGEPLSLVQNRGMQIEKHQAERHERSAHFEASGDTGPFQF